MNPSDALHAHPSAIGSAAAGAVLPRISVVMPAHNAEGFLRRSLPPLLALRQRGLVAEVLVVDDGATDHTAGLAAALGATVLHTGGPLGPAAARNLAARQAQGDVLWFVDADVVVHPGTAERLLQRLAQDPGLTALFGSYCDQPPAPGFFSQYKNLLHHFHHQRQGGPSTSFWAGCGAVRTRAFLQAGGFDAQLFAQPSIEDIELGHRLCRQGQRIALDPQLLCTHLKQWRLGQLVAVDVLRRALPWSRLILSGRAPADELNVSADQRRAAALALALAATLALAWHPQVGPVPALAAVMAALVAAAWANAPLLRFFHRQRGLRFAVAAGLFQQVVYLYSSASYAWCWIGRGRGAARNGERAKAWPS